MAGDQKWSRDLGKMTIYNYFGEGCSPVVHGDSVVLNWDHQGGSFIIVVDAKTGETTWKVDRDEYTSWATPLVVDYKGRTQVIVNGTNRVRSFDLHTGDVIWQTDLPAAGTSVPVSYEVDGEQYIFMPAGGHSMFGTTMGDSVMAYRLKR
jgi:glucose dehydrogenase